MVTLVASTRSTEATTSYHWWLYLHGAEPLGTKAEPPSAPTTRARSRSPRRHGLPRPRRTATRKTYARLDVAGTERPDVVVIDQPFEVTLGLQQRKDSGLVASSPLAMEVGRDRRARGGAAPRPDVDRGHRQPAGQHHRHRPPALPDGDAHLHGQVRRGARGRTSPRPAAAPRRPGRGDRLAHDRRGRQRGPRRGRRRARASRRRPPRPRPAAGRPAARPGHLDLPRRRREGHRSSGRRTPPTRPSPSPTCPARPRSTTTSPSSRPRSGARSSSPAARPRTTSPWPDEPCRSAAPSPRGSRSRSAASPQRSGRTTAPAVLLLTEELVVPWELACLEPELSTHGAGPRRSWARTSRSRGGRSTSTSRGPARAAPSRSDRLPCSPPTTPGSRDGSASKARSPRPARSPPSSRRRRRPSRPSS